MYRLTVHIENVGKIREMGRNGKPADEKTRTTKKGNRIFNTLSFKGLKSVGAAEKKLAEVRKTYDIQRGVQGCHAKQKVDQELYTISREK